MINIIKITIVPLISLVALVFGHTFFTSYVSLRLNSEGEANMMIGAVYAAHSIGFVFGAVFIERFIERLGHIRSFSLFATIISAAMLGHTLIYEPYIWLFFRFVGGASVAGIYVVIESWLLVLSDKKSRGRALSVYMIALYGAQGLSQSLLRDAQFDSFLPFVVAAICCSLSVIPVMLKKVDCPKHDETSLLSLKSLFLASPIGFVACFFSGLLIAPVYGLLPVYVQDIGLGKEAASTLMMVTIFGALILQALLGHLSDLVNRTTLLLGLVFSICALSVFLFFAASSLSYLLLGTALFFYGGMAFATYPIGISITSDYLKPKELVAGIGALVLLYGIGAVVGPIVAPLFMNKFPGAGFFLYSAFACAVLTLYCGYRIFRRTPLSVEEQNDILIVPQTSTHVAELDPRTPLK